MEDPGTYVKVMSLICLKVPRISVQTRNSAKTGWKKDPVPAVSGDVE